MIDGAASVARGRALLALLAAVFGTSAAAYAGPVPMNAQTLDSVTAAEAGTWQPGSAARQTGGSGDTLGRPGPSDGPIHDPQTGLVVDGRARQDSRAEIRLTGNALAGSRAMNEVNAGNSDVAQGVNVIDRGAAERHGASAARLSQSNGAAQTDVEHALIGQFSALGPTLEHSVESTGAVTDAATASHSVQNIDRTEVLHSTATTFSAKVVPQHFGLFDNPVSLGGRSITLPTLELAFDPLAVNFSNDGLDGKKFDLSNDATNTSISVPAHTFSNITLTLGEVELDHKDIVIKSPQLTIPSWSFTWCFFGQDNCDSDSKLAVTITVPKVTLSLGDKRLSGANPLGGLGISFGYAVAGDGTITFNAGGIEFSGKIPIDIGALTKNAFKLDIPGVDTFDKLVGHFDLPRFQFPVNDVVANFPSPDAFSRNVSGQACTYSQNRQDCVPLNKKTQDSTLVDQSHGDTQHSEHSHSETHSRVENTSRRGEVRVKEGQANLVVLRNSSSENKQYNLVLVGDDAQSGARVLNAVNSAAAIVGNGLNVVGSRTGQEQVARATTGLSQLNTFHQIGGRGQ